MGFTELFCYPISGLYDECHSIEYAQLVDARRPVFEGPQSLRNLNNLWWKEATSTATIKKIAMGVEARYRGTVPDVRTHKIVLADPKRFAVEVQEALKGVANLGAGPKPLFRHLETLQIFCNVYSDFISYPYRLSLQEGVLLNELNTKTLLREAQDATKNPYLPFIEENLFPVIEQANPDILWLVGPPKTSLICAAIFAKTLNPNVHVSFIGHSTEYYSLNKIAHLLKKNDLLFEVIDSIVLDDFEHTIPQLRDAVEHGDPLPGVPNLLYVDQGRIQQTGYQKTDDKSVAFNSTIHADAVLPEHRGNDWTDAGEVATVKLWPNSKCFWSACNFCAINKKYNTLPFNNFNDVSPALAFFEKVQSRGKGYAWSIDEAIPPENLEELAEALVKGGNQVRWETRSKIHAGFSKEVCQKLFKAGLREIRLGLESASARVLERMGKHSEGWSLNLVEEVVRNFHDAGISVHFPTIVGFPTETKEERQETYDFLAEIVEKYPSVTFNINVLGLDVGAKLFQKYEDFSISEIRWPSDPKYFLGNLLDWNSISEPFDYYSLDASRDHVMRQLLYPWMPESSELPVYMFYRLAETSRATLVWKSLRSERNDWTLSDFEVKGDGASAAISDGVVFMKVRGPTSYDAGNRYFVYDWGTHHQLEVDDEGLALIKKLRNPISIRELEEAGIYNAAKRLYDIGMVAVV